MDRSAGVCKAIADVGMLTWADIDCSPTSSWLLLLFLTPDASQMGVVLPPTKNAYGKPSPWGTPPSITHILLEKVCHHISWNKLIILHGDMKCVF